MSDKRNIYYFGDSIMGQHVATGWAFLHAIRKQIENPNLRAQFSIYGGGDSSFALERMKIELPFGEASQGVASIYIGVGIVDSSNQATELALGRFTQNMGEIIDVGQDYTEELRVVGLTRPEQLTARSSATGRVYSRVTIERFDANLRDLCRGRGVTYIPMSDVLKSGDFSDGLHPNAQGHQKMLERVLSF